MDQRPALVPVPAASRHCKAAEQVQIADKIRNYFVTARCKKKLVHLFFPQEAAAQSAGHPLKAVPIAVAEEDGSESEEDELKPRGAKIVLASTVHSYLTNFQLNLLK